MNSFVDLENTYQLLDFSISHNRMLIRSMRNRSRDYNIDLYFKGVSGIFAPMYFKGIEISSSDQTEIENSLHFMHQLPNEMGYQLFTLKDSNGNSYYLNAAAWGVFHNKRNILESTLINDNWEDLGDLVLWFE